MQSDTSIATSSRTNTHTRPEHFTPPTSPRTSAAFAAEEKRVPVLHSTDLISPSPVQSTSTLTGKRKATKATQELELSDLPRFKSGKGKGQINYAQVSRDMEDKNRRYPCSHCRGKGSKGNKAKKGEYSYY